MSVIKRDLTALATEALDVQDASNLAGVLRGATRALDDLRKIEGCTDMHPVMQLWADKIAHLTGTQSAAWDAYDAYAKVIELKNQEETDA